MQHFGGNELDVFDSTDINFLCRSLKILMDFFPLQVGSLWAGDSENSCDVEKIFLKILSLLKRVQGVAV